MMRGKWHVQGIEIDQDPMTFYWESQELINSTKG